jgi:amino acid transporter
MATPASDLSAPAQAAPRRQLTLFDSTSIIVGIIIGSTIYESTPLIANMVPGSGWLTWTVPSWLFAGLHGPMTIAVSGTAWLVGFWLLGGLLSLVWVVRPGSIGAMAYVFARYANELVPLGQLLGPVPGRALLTAWAAAAIVVLSLVNMLGVQQGKWTQNLLTLAKLLGLVAIVAAGFAWAMPAGGAAPAGPPTGGDFRLALILILYAYGGWNEMAYVAAEVREPEKNIVRALVLGTLAVTLIYIVLNLAFVQALGFEGLRNAKAVATEVLERTPAGRFGANFISLLICITALGAINGLIFTGSRIYYAMGSDHRLFAWLGQWSARWGTPVRSLLVQAVVTLALVVGFGLMPSTVPGRESAFDSMVKYTTPVFWFFFLLIGETLFILRDREPQVPRPFRIPWFPRLAIWFYLSSLFMLYSSLSYAIENGTWEALWAVAIVLVGLVLSYFDPRMKPTAGQALPGGSALSSTA